MTSSSIGRAVDASEIPRGLGSSSLRKVIWALFTSYARVIWTLSSKSTLADAIPKYLTV